MTPVYGSFILEVTSMFPSSSRATMLGICFWCIIITLAPHSAYAWDKDIHERIGEAVSRVLSYRDIEDLNKLLKGQSIPYMSRYAHDKLQYANYDRTVENHYETQLRDWQCTFDVNNPDKYAESQGLYHSIHDIFGRVTHASKSGEDHGIAKDMTEPVQISWLLGLVQDLHQPLHTGFGADDHGRRISVQYHDDPSTNLYDFWERDISSAANLETQLVLKAYNAELDKLVQDGGYGIQLVNKIYSKGIAEWIAESMEMSCSDIYSVIAGGRGREVPRMYQIDDDVYAKWRDLATKQVVKAAARSAVVLHGIAVHARYYHPEIVGSLSKSSKIQRHRVRGNWMQALAKNFIIAVIIVPSILVFLNYPQFVKRLMTNKDNRSE